MWPVIQNLPNGNQLRKTTPRSTMPAQVQPTIWLSVPVWTKVVQRASAQFTITDAFWRQLLLTFLLGQHPLDHQKTMAISLDCVGLGTVLCPVKGPGL